MDHIRRPDHPSESCLVDGVICGHASDCATHNAPPGPCDCKTGGTEWGVFRRDTEEQVGVGTTENRDTAWEDLAAWQKDGFDVLLRSRPVGKWVDVPE